MGRLSDSYLNKNINSHKCSAVSLPRSLRAVSCDGATRMLQPSVRSPSPRARAARTRPPCARAARALALRARSSVGAGAATPRARARRAAGRHTRRIACGRFPGVHAAPSRPLLSGVCARSFAVCSSLAPRSSLRPAQTVLARVAVNLRNSKRGGVRPRAHSRRRASGRRLASLGVRMHRRLARARDRAQGEAGRAARQARPGKQAIMKNHPG